LRPGTPGVPPGPWTISTQHIQFHISLSIYLATAHTMGVSSPPLRFTQNLTEVMEFNTFSKQWIENWYDNGRIKAVL